MAHLTAVLDHVDTLEAYAADPDVVRLAAWFHDAVYLPERSENEERSARLAERALPEAGVPDAKTAEVARLVRLTVTHDPADDDRDGQVLCDADLAILAAPPSAYAAYTAAVREEYHFVPGDAFRSGRSAILRRLLDLPRLFRTPYGQGALGGHRPLQPRGRAGNAVDLRKPPPYCARMRTMSRDQVEAAVASCTAALRPALERDWEGVRAAGMEWSCRTTAFHIAEDFVAYASRLAGRAGHRPPLAVSLPEGTGNAGLLQVIEATGALLAAAVRTAPPGVRAFHANHFGSADRGGFAAMGVAEALLHTHDITRGLGLPTSRPADLAASVLAWLFPHVRPGPEPWPTLLWATGRGELPGRAPVTDWTWYNNLVLPAGRVTLTGIRPGRRRRSAPGRHGRLRLARRRPPRGHPPGLLAPDEGIRNGRAPARVRGLRPRPGRGRPGDRRHGLPRRPGRGGPGGDRLRPRHRRPRQATPPRRCAP